MRAPTKQAQDNGIAAVGDHDMAVERLRLLIVEPSEPDAVRIVNHLQGEGFDVASEWVEDADSMRTALANGTWDVVFCEVQLPEFDAVTALDMLTAITPDTPFVAMSGVLSEEALVRIIRAGALDFFRKDDLSRMASITRRALAERRSAEARIRSEVLYKESEARFLTLVRSLPDSVIIYDTEGRVVFVNQAIHGLLGAATDDDLIGCHFRDFIDPTSLPEVVERFHSTMKTGRPAPPREHQRITVDGRRITVETSATRISWQGKPALLAILRDVTVRQEALERAQANEAFTSAVLENVADGVVIINTRGLIESLNPAAQQIFGYETAEVKGMNVAVLMNDDDAAHHDTYVKRYVETGSGGMIGFGSRELIGKRKDGSLIPLEITISSAYVGSDGFFIGVVRDISERKQAERALRESEEWFRSAFDTAPHGMALVSPQGRWIKVNAALCALFGYSVEELLQTDFCAVTGTDLFHVELLLDSANRAYQIEKRCRCKDGTEICILLSLSLIYDNEGRPLRYIAQVFDLTTRKAAEEERDRLESQLRHAQKLESLGTLSGGIAHEFNNLLLPIGGLIELSLADVEDKPEVHHNLSRVLENTQRASGLVQKILSFSRIEDAVRTEIDPATVIDNAISLLRAMIPSSISISTRLDHTVGLAHMDESQLHQVVMNLGVNAMQAIEGHTGSLSFVFEEELVTDRRRLAVGELEPGRYGKLSVQDSGCGMDGGTVARIFEPFFTTKEVGEGTGMGLAFIHGVIASHGGAIDVRSRPFEGTTFEIYFPLLAAQNIQEVAAM